MRKKELTNLGLVFGAMLVLAGSASAATLNVPQNYPTIQSAIDAASWGDTVLVAPGDYTESIRLKPGVTVQGSGANVTTLRGDGSWFKYPQLTYTVLGADNSTISGFTITGSLGNIFCYHSSPIITNNVIIGGYLSEAIRCENSSPTITNNVLLGGLWGASIYLWYSSPIIVNNTIIKWWIGIVSEYSSPIITNNIIADNAYGISAKWYSFPIISYNNLWGNYYKNYNGCLAGFGDISANPLFVNPTIGDYHLQANSPCIDVGTNDAPALPETDFDGNSRIFDGDLDGVAIVDMGAFEYSPPIIKVMIDIKPGSDPNSINPDSKGVIPVAILTTNTTAGELITFDAAKMDAATVHFGPTKAECIQYDLEDVDKDGDMDMVLHFKTQDTGIRYNETVAVLTGKTVDGKNILGVDLVRTVSYKGK